METDYFKYGVVREPQKKHSILEAIFRLRYQVYVAEWGFENPEDHPHGLEKDDHDSHSIYIYAYRDSEENVIGTARIILHSELGFPIEKHFNIQNLPDDIMRCNIGEISRLSISKLYRRREIDHIIFSRGQAGINERYWQDAFPKSLEIERRKCEHELIRGIYLLIYRESLKLGLTHWYAVMAKGLHLILKRWGIPFQQIGSEKDYHGLRAPYLLSIRALEENLQQKNPDLLKIAKSIIAK